MGPFACPFACPPRVSCCSFLLHFAAQDTEATAAYLDSLAASSREGSGGSGGSGGEDPLWMGYPSDVCPAPYLPADLFYDDDVTDEFLQDDKHSIKEGEENA